MPTRKVSKPKQAVLSILAGLGMMYFVIGFQLMIPYIRAMQGQRFYHIVFSVPYAGLFCMFLVSLFLALRERLGWSAILLITALLLSAWLCGYDLTHGVRAQILGGGVGHVYLFWWWYSEPFWYGYKPGNV